MENTIIYKGIAYSFSTEKSDWAVRWTTGSIDYELKIAAFVPNISAGHIEVIYVFNRYDNTTKTLISTERTPYYEHNFDEFYNAVVPYSVGRFCATQCINGMTRRHKFFDGSEKRMEGAMFYSQEGSLRQPVSFGASIVHAIEQISYTEPTEEQPEGEVITTITPGSITVDPIDGQTPFTYSINQGAAQESNVFENLQPGVYEVRTTDSTGQFRIQYITIHREDH